MIATLWIKEHDGIARRSFPVTGGLALGAGIVFDAGRLVLYDEDKQPVPLQAQALTHWPDGSVRWVLVDLQADLAAYETRQFHLDHGQSPQLPPLSPTGVVDGEPLPRLETTIPVVGSYVHVVDADGRQWTARQPGPTVVEQRNGLRTTVCTSGAVVAPHGDKRLLWQARTDFFLGHPWTRTRFTYIAESDEDIRLAELAVIVLTDAPAGAGYCFAGSLAPWNAPTQPVNSSQPGAIIQSDANDSRVVTLDGEVLYEQTLKNRGYVGVQVGNRGLALGLAEMWQSFPKELQVTPESLQVMLWPATGTPDLVLSPGVARTHTIFLAPYETPAALDEFMTGMNTPILPQMAVEDWNRAGVLPALLPPADTTVPYIEALTRAMFTGFTTFTTRANAGVWGLGELNWGDFRAESYEARQVPGVYGEGIVWGNGEAQVPYGFLVQYLRTGRIEYLLHGLACARHEADVDTIHAGSDPDAIGGQHVHSVDHTHGVVTTSHEWTSGIALAYLLTGDGRLRAVLCESGEHLVRVALHSPLDAFQCRDGGWLLIGLCACYEALDDERYLQAGRRVLTGIRHWIKRGATTLLPPAMHVHSPVHLFIALTGVADYLRLTADEQARQTLLEGGRLVLERGRDEAGFFFIADGPSYRTTGRWPTCHSLPVLSALYELTGDREWIEVGLHQARLMLRILEAQTRWGQETNWAQGGIYLAYAFSFFESARRLGLLEDL